MCCVAFWSHNTVEVNRSSHRVVMSHTDLWTKLFSFSFTFSQLLPFFYLAWFIHDGTYGERKKKDNSQHMLVECPGYSQWVHIEATGGFFQSKKFGTCPLSVKGSVKKKKKTPRGSAAKRESSVCTRT